MTTTDKPTPHTLTIVATGANHALLFKGNVTAQVAYRNLTKQWGAVLISEFTHQANPETPRLLPLFSLEDDFGSRVDVNLLELKSTRVTDLTEEQSGAGYLKIAELFAATGFEELIKDKYPGLYASLRARQGGQGIVMPGRVGAN